MTDTRRGPNTRGIGQTQLLYIDLARGDRDAVMKRLDDLAGLQIGGAGIELLTLITAISTGSVVPPQLLQAASDSLAATVARETFQTLPLHDRFKKLATLGSIDALLGDSASASAVARRLEKWSTAPDEKRPADSHAAMIRALLARKEHRHEDVIRWTERTFEYRWFGDAIFDPLTAYSITRFIRAEAFLALGRSDEADAWFATIGDHDPSDLAFLGSAIEHRQRIAKARGDLTEAARLGRQLEALRH